MSTRRLAVAPRRPTGRLDRGDLLTCPATTSRTPRLGASPGHPARSWLKIRPSAPAVSGLPSRPARGGDWALEGALGCQGGGHGRRARWREPRRRGPSTRRRAPRWRRDSRSSLCSPAGTSAAYEPMAGIARQHASRADVGRLRAVRVREHQDGSSITLLLVAGGIERNY